MHYDGDPPIAIGTAALLAGDGVAGTANLLPFTFMPDTLIASAATTFRKDCENIPWVNIGCDRQDDTGIDTHLQAFMYQAKEHAASHGRNVPVA